MFTRDDRNHYKSWSGLKKRLEESVCAELSGRITYFLTYFNEVHNAYGRASVRLDGEETCSFSWYDSYVQENDVNEEYKCTGEWNFSSPALVEKWKRDGTFSEFDFTAAATAFLNMSIADALASDEPLIRLFAILDKRVGKRTLKRIYDDGAWREYPDWLKRFYLLRFEENC